MCTHWTQLKSSDKQAFAQLYEHYVDILYNYGVHFVTDTDLVQDAIQDLFIDVWRMRENLSPTTSVKYYLFRSLRRKLRSLVEPNELLVELSDTEAFLPIDEVKSQEEAFIEEDTQRLHHNRLQKILLQLPPRQSEAIRLRFFDEFSLEEVASIMQMNEQSVRNLIQRSIKHLRELFIPLVGLLMALLQFF